MTISTYAIPGVPKSDLRGDIYTIILKASVFLKVSPINITGPCRKREYTTPRHLIMHYLTTRHHSLNKIGEAFGRDHSTVINARNQINRLTSVYPEIEELKTKLHLHLNN